jgi:hypothetical protein
MRVLACPTRMPGETGQAFIDRMLAELNAKGSATALPTPPKIEITATTAKVAKEHVDRSRRVRPPASLMPVADPASGATVAFGDYAMSAKSYGQRIRTRCCGSVDHERLKIDTPGSGVPPIFECQIASDDRPPSGERFGNLPRRSVQICAHDCVRIRSDCYCSRQSCTDR